MTICTIPSIDKGACKIVAGRFSDASTHKGYIGPYDSDVAAHTIKDVKLTVLFPTKQLTLKANISVTRIYSHRLQSPSTVN